MKASFPRRNYGSHTRGKTPSFLNCRLLASTLHTQLSKERKISQETSLRDFSQRNVLARLPIIRERSVIPYDGQLIHFTFIFPCHRQINCPGKSLYNLRKQSFATITGQINYICVHETIIFLQHDLSYFHEMNKHVFYIILNTTISPLQNVIHILLQRSQQIISIYYEVFHIINL